MTETFFLGGKAFVAESEAYTPREDSFLLKECLEQELERNKGLRTGLDLGFGTGIQGLAMAQKGLKVVCVDLNPKAVENAKQNFKRAGLKAKFKESDLFSNIKEKFDLIAFNPPYLPSDRVKFKELEGGKGGREVLDKFLDRFPEHLNEKGVCLFLQSSLNRVKKTEQKLKQAGLKFEVVGSKKLFFEELFVFKAWRA